MATVKERYFEWLAFSQAKAKELQIEVEFVSDIGWLGSDYPYVVNKVVATSINDYSEESFELVTGLTIS